MYSTRDIDEGLLRLIYKKPTSHAIGNAFFSICESKEGSGIYGRAMQADFKFIP